MYLVLCVLKIETIGDAYCVAGGLHRYSFHHAERIALMALKMMHETKQTYAAGGIPLKVSLYRTAITYLTK